MKKLITLILALAMTMSMTACSSAPASSETTEGEGAAEFLSIQGTEDGVLTVGMECQYAPYNWTQLTDANGAVEIANNPGAYANGYDVMIAKKICEEYGWQLEVMALEWGGLTPALNAGTI
ncbi:MAG: ABC transporter substrate-binding protein, partial [Oscillospiraceae bacterium]|nr:ABC transporter substrate-binding protein [Oscillospiraceae bacterium]